jgi:hypothetical protein
MSKHLALVIFAAASNLAGSLVNAQAVISIDPTVQTTSTGSVVTVDVDISNVSDLYGYQFDLGFNPSVLQAVSSSEAPFLAGRGSTFFIAGTNDNLGGTVLATADTLLTATNGVNGSGELAVFAFDAVGAGTSTLSIQNETLLNSGLSVIGDLTKTGLVTVSSQTVAAPEIDAPSTIIAMTLLLGGLAVIRGRRSTYIAYHNRAVKTTDARDPPLNGQTRRAYKGHCGPTRTHVRVEPHQARVSRLRDARSALKSLRINHSDRTTLFSMKATRGITGSNRQPASP